MQEGQNGIVRQSIDGKDISNCMDKITLPNKVILALEQKGYHLLYGRKHFREIALVGLTDWKKAGNNKYTWNFENEHFS